MRYKFNVNINYKTFFFLLPHLGGLRFWFKNAISGWRGSRPFPYEWYFGNSFIHKNGGGNAFAYSQKVVNFASSIGDRWNESDPAKEKHLFD